MKNGSIQLFSIVCFVAVMLSGLTSTEVLALNLKTQVIEKQEELTLYKKLKENDSLPIAERIALYHQLKAEHFDEYNFGNEQELNNYGYYLLFDKRLKEAIEIFKIMVDEFPNSANAYDSMAEAYFRDGNAEMALLNDEKSLKLNPDNNRAIDRMNKLNGLELLVTEWGKEIFHFPIHFAPEITYQGVEEVVFPKNWIKPDSTDFWSYVFIWRLEQKQAVTATELDTVLKLYFDGLMAGVNKNKDKEILKTSTHFQKNTNGNDSVAYTGALTIFDAFATNEALNLNARVYSDYCEEKDELFLLFRFSPIAFDQPIWDKLRTVTVRKTVCEE